MFLCNKSLKLAIEIGCWDSFPPHKIVEPCPKASEAGERNKVLALAV